MARETTVQSQIESYQRLEKWFMMPPCLTLGIIRYGSRVKWINPGKEVAPSPTPWCSSYRKGAFGSPLTMVDDYGGGSDIFFIIILRYLFHSFVSSLGHFLTLLGSRGVTLHPGVSCLWWWNSSNTGTLRNMEYPFIAITSMFTPARSSSTR